MWRQADRKSLTGCATGGGSAQVDIELLQQLRLIGLEMNSYIQQP